VLGDHSGRELEAGTLRLERRGAAFVLRYHERVFPVAPRSLDRVLASAAERTQSATLAFLADAFGDLPLATATDHASVTRRHRDKEVLRALLDRLLADEPPIAAAVDAEIAAVNADPVRLDAVLERQNYRLAYWRAADRDLGYRRFFDIDTLVGLRAEDPRVFEDTHRLILEWVAEGAVQGLRIDHPDGLRDPEGYCRRLRAHAPQAWIVVEKILEPEERLRETWPVDGTTGYDFAATAGELFVDPAAAPAFAALHREFTGQTADWPAVVHEKKLLACRELLGSDVSRLAALFLEVCERHPRHRDHTRHALTEVLREVIAAFPVYRSYVQAETRSLAPEDVAAVETAVDRARRARPELDGSLLEFLQSILLLRVRGPLETELVMRFQQLTGPAMAKGVEDTAYYGWTRFVALNEVGGDPERFGASPGEFHRAAADRHYRWPRTLLATSTHDTKRSHDVRARLYTLSEVPERWAAAVHRWAAHNARHRTDGQPDRDAEYLFYQTLVGAWPLDPARAWAYMEKAAREAKAFTSWTRPDARYEAALRAFVEGALGDPEFTADVERFTAPLVAAGRVNSLAQLLIQLTAPGVPDLYQGSELWDLSLVDPDNRRPVDFELRRRLLDALGDLAPEVAWARADEGLPRLLVVHRALALRREYPALFGVDAAYRALAVTGARAGHVLAFARGERAVTAVPRLCMHVTAADWLDTRLEIGPGRWRNVLTGDAVGGGAVPVEALFRRFPVALLARTEGPA
jgi:(1->4)-alpha-D-glucan 1-alpha-D-glucosylmutase